VTAGAVAEGAVTVSRVAARAVAEGAVTVSRVAARAVTAGAGIVGAGIVAPGSGGEHPAEAAR
jgi:hypothetical protein